MEIEIKIVNKFVKLQSLFYKENTTYILRGYNILLYCQNKKMFTIFYEITGSIKLQTMDRNSYNIPHDQRNKLRWKNGFLKYSKGISCFSNGNYCYDIKSKFCLTILWGMYKINNKLFFFLISSQRYHLPLFEGTFFLYIKWRKNLVFT